MNTPQKVILGAALAIFLVTLCAAPWEIKRGQFSKPTTAPVFNGPENGYLKIGVLFVDWMGIGVVAGVLFFMCKQK